MCGSSGGSSGGDRAAQRLQAETQARALDYAREQQLLERPLVEQSISRGAFGQEFLPSLRSYLESPLETPLFQEAADKGLTRLRSTYAASGSPSSGPAQVAGGEFLRGLTSDALARRDANLFQAAGFQGSPVQSQVAPFLNIAQNAADNLSSLALNRGQNSGFGQFAGQAVGAAAGAALPFLFGLCVVAAAIYGRGTYQFHLARYWIAAGWQGRIAEKVRLLYLRHGVRLAQLAETHKPLKAVLKVLFDIAVRKGEADLRAKLMRS